MIQSRQLPSLLWPQYKILALGAVEDPLGVEVVSPIVEETPQDEEVEAIVAVSPIEEEVVKEVTGGPT